jgi:hypothetical protein
MVKKIVTIKTKVYAPKQQKYDPKSLAKEIKVEMEHTPDKKLSKHIAQNHLDEDPKYYTKLAKAKL